MKSIFFLSYIYRKVNANYNSYYSHYSYYQKLIEHYNDLSEYLRVIYLYKSKESLKTNHLISTKEDIGFNTINKKQLLKEFKQPQSKHKMVDNDLNIEIYFYKVYLGEYRVRMEMHLSNDKLFYFNYTFINHLTNHQKNDIITIIQDKYLKGATFDILTQKIVDKNEVVLHIEDLMEFKIHYMCASSNSIQMIDSYRKINIMERNNITVKKRNELKVSL